MCKKDRRDPRTEITDMLLKEGLYPHDKDGMPRERECAWDWCRIALMGIYTHTNTDGLN